MPDFFTPSAPFLSSLPFSPAPPLSLLSRRPRLPPPLPGGLPRPPRPGGLPSSALAARGGARGASVAAALTARALRGAKRRGGKSAEKLRRAGLVLARAATASGGGVRPRRACALRGRGGRRGDWPRGAGVRSHALATQLSILFINAAFVEQTFDHELLVH